MKKRSGLRRTTAGVLVALGIATAGTVLIATPAQAAPGSCSLGYTCLWADPNFETNGSGSAKKSFYQYISNFGSHQYAGTTQGLANSASSIKNNGVSETVHLYRGSNKNNYAFSMPNGTQIAFMALYANDDTESGYYDSFN